MYFSLSACWRISRVFFLVMLRAIWCRLAFTLQLSYAHVCRPWESERIILLWNFWEFLFIALGRGRLLTVSEIESQNQNKWKRLILITWFTLLVTNRKDENLNEDRQHGKTSWILLETLHLLPSRFLYCQVVIEKWSVNRLCSFWYIVWHHSNFSSH